MCLAVATVEDVLTITDRETGEQHTEVLAEGSITTDAPRATEQVETSEGVLQLAAVIDAYHAKKTVGIGWSTGKASGWVSYTYTIALYNHSASVQMGYIETTGKAVLMNWRLRIRHDKTAARDTTLFTYPEVMGPSTYRQTYSETEERYGDGYNRLPYETDWKVFWDSYDISIRYGGINVYSDNTAQSDRATCYKTVSCKFKG